MASDLLAGLSALLLQASVVGITLTDTGKVEACEERKGNVRRVRGGHAIGWVRSLSLTVPPEVAEGSTEAWSRKASG
jgi:hypothetical protein